VSKDLRFVARVATGLAECHTSSNFCYALSTSNVVSHRCHSTHYKYNPDSTGLILPSVPHTRRRKRRKWNEVATREAPARASRPEILFRMGNFSGHAGMFLKTVDNSDICMTFFSFIA